MLKKDFVSKKFIYQKALIISMAKKPAKKPYRKQNTIRKTVLKDVQFDRPLFIVFVAALILLLSLVIYSKYGINIQETQQTINPGNECLIDSDCPQVRCPGMKSTCENGFCVVRKTDPNAPRCIDLKNPLCGNGICESDEQNRCSEDC